MKNIGLILVLSIALSLEACGFMQMTVSDVKLGITPAHRQNVEAIKQAHPDACGVLMGNIISDKSNGMLVVVALSEDLLNTKPADISILSEPGPYMLYVPQGHYRIVAFVDFNKNRVCDQNELVGQLENPGIVAVKGGQIIGKLDFPVTDQGKYFVEFPIDVQLPEMIGAVKKTFERCAAVNFDDSVFSGEYGSMGLWSPAQFIDEVGVNIYALDKYDSGKIPILFVHGSGGTPRDWKYLAVHIDRKKFQSWFFFYPSGLRLETISHLLYEKLSYLHDIYKFPTLCITAHSMGGLVVRSFLNRYARQHSPYSIKLFVSISTPWSGVASAKLAPEKSLFKGPPVWKDLVPGSPFLQELYKHRLPNNMEYYLFFGYRSNSVLIKKADDGVIALESQLYPVAQSEATKCFGFNENHVGILSCKDVLDQYVRILSAVYAKSFPDEKK